MSESLDILLSASPLSSGIQVSTLASSPHTELIWFPSLDKLFFIAYYLIKLSCVLSPLNPKHPSAEAAFKEVKCI